LLHSGALPVGLLLLLLLLLLLHSMVAMMMHRVRLMVLRAAVRGVLQRELLLLLLGSP
jgi:hypothetical protein